MRRPSGPDLRRRGLVILASALVACTYGLVRLTFGLFLPDVQSSLGLDTPTAGSIASASSLAYCAAALVGLLLHRRPRSTVVAAAAAAALGSAGMALATGVATFAVCAVLSSTGSGLASPGLVTVIARNVASARVDRAQAVVNGGVGPGLVAAGVLALVLLPDWRLAWSLVAVGTALVAVGVLLLDRPAAGAPAPHRAGRPPRLRPRVYAGPAAAAVLLGAGSAVLWTYGRSHLAAAGASAQGSVVAWIALGAGGTTAILTARRLAALPVVRVWAVTAGAVAAGTALLGGTPHPLVLAWGACAVFGWGFTAATSALITWATRIDAARAAGGTSVLFVALVLGQALGASGAGLVAGHLGLGAAFGLAAVVAAAAAALPLVTERVGLRTPAG